VSVAAQRVVSGAVVVLVALLGWLLLSTPKVHLRGGPTVACHAVVGPMKGASLLGQDKGQPDTVDEFFNSFDNQVSHNYSDGTYLEATLALWRGCQDARANRHVEADIVLAMIVILAFPLFLARVRPPQGVPDRGQGSDTTRTTNMSKTDPLVTSEGEQDGGR